MREFFWKHHVERLYSASLQHVQPWYYYFPVLLGGLFPWTPLIGLLASKGMWRDQRKRFLAGVFCCGFFLFSVSLNKLPGYLLPLFPSIFVLLASQIEVKSASRAARPWLVPCALLIATIPILAQVLPQWLTMGRPSSFPNMGGFTPLELFCIAAPVAVVFAARRFWLVGLLILCVVFEGVYLKEVTYPVLDREVSARGLWRETNALQGTVCDGGVNREWQYGLAFYRGSPVPSCQTGKFDFALRPLPHGPPSVEPLNQKKPVDPIDRPAK